MELEDIRIAVLSAYDVPLTFLDNTVSNAMQYFNDTLHTYVTGSAYTYTFKTYSDHEDASYLVVGNKISFKYKEKGYYLNIVNVEKNEKYITVIAYGLLFELLNEEIGAYKASSAMSITQYISAFNFEVAFTVGNNAVSNKKITYEWEGTETVLARLYSLATVFDAEAEFVTELDTDYSLKQITLNFYKEHDSGVQGIGTDRTSETIRYGVDVDGITKTSDATELYTAIRPTGTDGLNLSSLTKTEYDEYGNVLYSKPKNAIEILAPQARNRFPSALTPNSSGRYICKVWSYETSNVNTLYGQALAQLKKYCNPQVSYDVSGYIDANIGDTFTIEDDEYTPTLYLEARITEQEISFTNPQNNKTTFDNFVEKTSQISSALLEKMNELINANKLYNGVIASDNGIVFKESTDTTSLTASVYDGVSDVTSSFTIKWYKDGTYLSDGTSITINATDITKTATYRFDAINSSEVIKATAEATVVFVSDGEAGTPGTDGKDGTNGTNGEDAINIVISSSNGMVFKNASISTVLTATVYKGGTELTESEISALGTIKWYKNNDTSVVVGTGISLTISLTDVTATYNAELEEV